MSEPAFQLDMQQALLGAQGILDRSVDLAPFLAVVGTQEALAMKDRIRTKKTDPWGGEWEPWAESTAAHRERKGNAAQGLLWDEGLLLNSVQFETTPTSVEIGTPDTVPYAVYLQDGTPRMPARPFAGWTDQRLDDIGVQLAAYLEHGVL